uniref:Uncharacterized protein n=1 Tax=Cacopsylla melanoneura TaxID=428564 RepID=A0A8D8Z2B8_9HEMI
MHFTLTIYTYITEVNYFFQKSNSTNCNEIRNNAIELLYLDYHKKINYPEKLPLKLKYPPDSSRAKEAREPSTYQTLCIAYTKEIQGCMSIMEKNYNKKNITNFMF